MKLIVATSGASGVNLGLKMLKLLPKEINKHIIMTKNSEVVLDKEMNITYHNNENISASISQAHLEVML